MTKNIIVLLGLFSFIFFQSCSMLKSASKEKIIVYTAKKAQKTIKKRKTDTIVLKDGVYRNVLFKFPKKSSNIVLMSQTPGGAIITGKSKIIVSGQNVKLKDLLFYNVKGYDNGLNRVLILKDADSCRITNCAFIDCGTPYTDQEKASGGLIIYLESNSKNNRIDHCYWEGSFGLCLAIGYKPEHEASKNYTDRVNRNNTIDSCYVKNISEWADLNGRPLNGNDPFMIGWNLPPYAPKSNNIVSHNLFENISSDSEIISVKMSNTTIAYNTFRNSPKTKYQSPQVTLRAGNNSIVKGNYFINTGAGITVHGDGHEIFNNYIDSDYMGIHLPGGKIDEYSYPGQNNCLIHNNTIVNTQFPIMFGKGNWTIKPGEKGNNSIFNNIIYIDKTKLRKEYNKPIIFLDRGYNSSENVNWKNNTVNSNIQDNYTISKYKRFLSDYKLTNVQIDNKKPVFDINKLGIYQLKPNSPLNSLKRGMRTLLKETSITTNSLDKDITPSELSSPVNNRPLNNSDVGPSWISDYTNFKEELIDYWKKWKIEDSIIDNDPAFITTPHFNSNNAILQFDLSEASGFGVEYDNINNKYKIYCTDNRPRIVRIPIQDFNENNLLNTKGDNTTAIIENWVKEETNCSSIISVTGNGEKIQFFNNLQLPMLVYADSKEAITIKNGGKLFMVKDSEYHVTLPNEAINNTNRVKKHKCSITYTIKP